VQRRDTKESIYMTKVGEEKRNESKIDTKTLGRGGSHSPVLLCVTTTKCRARRQRNSGISNKGQIHQMKEIRRLEQ
jgi:hypothetical protein